MAHTTRVPQLLLAFGPAIIEPRLGQLVGVLLAQAQNRALGVWGLRSLGILFQVCGPEAVRGHLGKLLDVGCRIWLTEVAMCRQLADGPLRRLAQQRSELAVAVLLLVRDAVASRGLLEAGPKIACPAAASHNAPAGSPDPPGHSPFTLYLELLGSVAELQPLLAMLRHPTK